ncbi:two-component regulator propeller domain-containing protein [Pusillimonas sp. SM2304]|uniref:sensor histidine kinase n=1 Tax=Pusillimonas sp. SM2304 TaxID=3073241 RepID=UPI0028743340|nr:two-component regulator propeller domain-containing protein [Pusillimonas sp. SM2304]MDS1139494.1 two-component regulator propeller domain-containing protein [Pusillimonas sp. SM2304]
MSSTYSMNGPLRVLERLWRVPMALGMCSVSIFLLSFSETLLASASQLDEREHRRWTLADEAPNQIGAMAQTRDGYLWLGTNDTLYRFDGLRFVRYTSPDNQTLGIVSALQAEDDGLWVGLRKGGVSFITEAGITNYSANDGLPRGVVYGIAKDRNDAVWIAANDGLARFDGETWQRIGSNWNFPGQHAHAVFLDRIGTLWAANEERLFYLPSGARKFIDAGIAVDRVSQITQAPDGSIWLAERYGGVLRRFVLKDKATVTLRTVVDGANGLLFDSNGALWVSTSSSGIRYMAPSDDDLHAALGKAKEYSVQDGLSAETVRSMLEDAEGNIWVGTSAGLDRFRPSDIVQAPFPKHALNFALAAGADGSVLAATSNLPVMRLSKLGLVHLDVPAPIHSAFSDPEGKVWLAGTNGIWRVQNDKTERVASLPIDDEPDSAVRAMTLDRAGNLWVSINRAGLFVLRNGRWSKAAPPNNDPSQLMPVSASTTQQGQLWFGYRNNLIVTYDDGGERHWGAKEGLQIGHVTAMLHQDGQTWVGGERGVALFNGKRFQSLRLPDNGLFDNIYAIIATPSDMRRGDGSYDLWLHSKNGIFQISTHELQRTMADPDHHISFRSHEAIGGLANDPHQVLPLPTAVRSTDGRLWFATSNGVIGIDPAQPAPKRANAKPLIESFTVDGTELPVNRLPQLEPQPKRIEIAYSALNLSGHHGMHFRYQLEGIDTDWQRVAAVRKAIYTDLGPGSYRFRVRATNPDGVLSADEASLRFSIRPVFYRDPLFILLCCIAAAAALWRLHRIKMQRATEQLRARLQERHAERERIARELHDTLLQSVQGLALTFQAVAESLPPADPVRGKMEHALGRADLVLVEARNRVSELRDVSRSGLSLITALTDLTRGLQEISSTNFTLSNQGTPRLLHPIVEEESYRIGHEALMNTVQHAHAKNVKIKVAYTWQTFQLIVSDDGNGIDLQYVPPNMRPGHWGLHGMLERAQKMGGRLSIRRGVHSGTVVELTVPASTAYRQGQRRLVPWLRALFRSEP